MLWHFYVLNPIDFDWEFMPTVREFKQILVRQDIEGDWSANPVAIDFHFEARREKIMECAKKLYWDGSLRGDVHVFTLPFHEQFKFGFVWMQDTGGTTFVASPVDMPWLLPPTILAYTHTTQEIPD